jgi:GlpG protein
MRLLVSLPDEDHAHRLGDYLLTIGIDNTVDEGSSGFEVWVKDDDKLDPAKRELADFTANPNDPRYSAAARDAERLRIQDEKRAKRLEKNYVDVRTQWAKRAGGFKPLTMALILFSCVVFVLTRFGGDMNKVAPLLTSATVVKELDPNTGEYTIKRHGFAELIEIRQGQIWRLITPIFVHYGPLHLIFNMFWMRDLGSMIEQNKGMLKFALLVLVTALLSNMAEYLVSGPGGGGMSGVVYALFGYVWMRGKYAPHEGLNLHPHTTFFMIAWFAICFTGLVGPIGNTAHTVGLLIGVVAGAWPHLKRKLLRRA